MHAFYFYVLSLVFLYSSSSGAPEGVKLDSQNSPVYRNAVSSTKSNCGKNEWTCDSGDCIKRSNVCDGIKHCSDGSDEGNKQCRKKNDGSSSPGSKKQVNVTTKKIFEKLNPRECGKRDSLLTSKIAGGRDSHLGDWPWMVAVVYEDTKEQKVFFTCGGSLIASRWILTAAHCLDELNSTRIYYARLGELDLDPTVQDGANPIDEPIEEIILHSEYTSNPVTNDIALIKLKNTVKFTPNIRPICLLNSTEHRSDAYYYNKKPYILGWGDTKYNGSSSPPTRLQEAEVKIVNNLDCVMNYDAKQIDSRVLCAADKGKDACQGDSGGPLIFEDAKQMTFYLGGMVSWGTGCANPKFPGVYTRIAAFADWIKKKTGLEF